MWQEFVDNTTLHGIRYVFMKRSIFMRMLWLILLLASGGYYVFTVYRAFNKYYSRPINNALSKSYSKKMEFPAVTICSLNSFARSKVLMPDNDPQFASTGLNMSSCAITAAVRGNRPCGQSMLCCCSPADSLPVKLPNCTSKFKQDLRDAINRSKHQHDMERFFRYYSQDITELLGPRCTFGWKGDNCSSSDFVPNVTPFGMCYTFNSEVGGKARTVDEGGASSGLNIVLDAQLHEYTQGEFAEGFKVLVNRPGEYIDQWKGINVAPGQLAAITVSELRIKNLPKPYSTNCVTKKLKTLATYTSDGCLYECLADAGIKSCGCRIIGYKDVPGVRACSTMEDRLCGKKAIEDLDDNACGCEVSCDQIEYSTEVSYAKFPDAGTARFLKKVGNYSNETYVRENLVLLQVGFKSLSYDIYEQQPAYDSNSLFGEIGGNMGLFLGCSLLTICEFMDFFIGLLATRRRQVTHVHPA